MVVSKFAAVFPVDDLACAVVAWTAALGVAPSFVDGTSWAQFDLVGGRLALAGTDRGCDLPGVMLKIDDLDAARDELVACGLTVGAIVQGPHERRFTAELPGGCATFYQPG
jgi:hypothetical protein